MSDAWPDSISLVVPVFNEAAHLARLLTTLDRIALPGPCELVIVNDGSTDGSGAIIRAFPFTRAARLVDGSATPPCHAAAKPL